jgi:hypothetical protein
VASTRCEFGHLLRSVPPLWFRQKLKLRSGLHAVDSAWDDVYDVFGSGDEHDWVLEDEAQQMGGFKEGEKLDMHDVSLAPISCR